MKTDLVGLAVLMALVTYPWRALPLLGGGGRRLSPLLREYLRLVAPAVLASLAAVSLAVAPDGSGGQAIRLGVEWLAVGSCVAIVVWRRQLLAGLAAAVVLAAVARAAGPGS